MTDPTSLMAFDPQRLASDLLEVRQLYTEFFRTCRAADWARHTEPGNRGWTLRETVAHLDAVGQAYLQAAGDALVGRPCDFPGMRQRADLPAWNRHQIQARSAQPIDVICAAFLDKLQSASEQVAGLSQTSLAQTIPVPFYHKPISIGELFAGEAAHPGIVHAAQVANGAGVPPLWRQYAPDLLQRQLTRFLHFMSLSYWPERGGDLRAAIQFNAAGPGGGRWTVCLAQEGSTLANETQPTLRLWFRSADALCRALTLQLNPIAALLTAQAFPWGDVTLAFRLGWLFNPA